MSNRMYFFESCSDSHSARIGGAALIGGIFPWPKTPEKVPQTLLMSIPTDFLNKHAGLTLPAGHFVSVFSYYSKNDYFLDYIAYHGNPKELELLRKGYTKVVLHPCGEEVSEAEKIPSMSIEASNQRDGDEDSFQGSKIGTPPCLLQSEDLEIEGYQFALQVRGTDFPKPYQDIFFLGDAVGYLYIDKSTTQCSGSNECGLFFVQVT